MTDPDTPDAGRIVPATIAGLSPAEARDRIEALSAEVERLRGALREAELDEMERCGVLTPNERAALTAPAPHRK